MKNNDNHRYHISKARLSTMHNRPIDVLVHPAVIAQNSAKLAQPPRRKRRVNYVKKIMNDPFIMGA